MDSLIILIFVIGMYLLIWFVFVSLVFRCFRYLSTGNLSGIDAVERN